MALTSEMTLEEKRRIEEDLRAELIKRAVNSAVVTSAEEAVVRDLLPGVDLGAPAEVWTQTLAGPGWNTTYAITLTSKKLIGIYGIKNKSAVPLTTEIRFGLGAGPARYKDIWEVESAWLELNTESITTQPIVYNKEEIITIEQYASAAGTDGVILLGLVCEPSGDVISR